MRTLWEFEIRYVLRALCTLEGNVSRTSRALNCSVKTVRKIRDLRDKSLYNIGEITALENIYTLKQAKLEFFYRALVRYKYSRSRVSRRLSVSKQTVNTYIKALRRDNKNIPMLRSLYFVDTKRPTQ